MDGAKFFRLGRFWKILHKLEVGNCAFEYLDVGIDVLGNRFHDNHIGDERGELPVKLHVVVSDDVEHSDQKADTLDIEDACVVQDAEQCPELLLVLIELSLQDPAALKVGQLVDHRCTFLTVAFHDGFYEGCEVVTVVLVELDDHSDIDKVNLYLVGAFTDHGPNLTLLIFARFV